jgi:N-carbamoylputrescine amidase
MSTRIVTIGLPQLMNAGSAEENLARTIAAIRRAAAQGAQIVCTQELFLGPYFCQTHDHAQFGLAEAVPGPTTDALRAVAKELRIVIVASVFERRTGGVYHNTAAVIDADGTYMGKYRKMHIPDDPQYHEKFYFTPGDLGFRVWHTRYATIGVLICWDQWYPEAARLTALQGAEILFYPTAIGWLPPEKEEYGERQAAAWETIQRGHAIANGCYVAAVNRVRTADSSSGGGASSQTRTGGSSPRPARTRRRSWCRAIWRRWTWCERTGLSSATVGSMRTPGLRSGTSMRCR